MSLDLNFVRAQFPGLAQPQIFMDNAGGSLALARVADRVRDYMVESSVQVGATYDTSAAAARRYRQSRARMAQFIGARRPEEVVFGPSSTILLKFLAAAMADVVADGDEIVVTRIDHEANIGCWLGLAQRSHAKIRFWEPNPGTGDLELEDLEPLLNERTCLVALTHVSNILGTIHQIPEITRRVHEQGGRVCVDGVAFAPHRPLDVAAWDVDYYVFSLYKVYGPHHAVLYGKHEALLELGSVNHYFVGKDQVPGKLEPGNANYELSYGAAGIVDYLEELGRCSEPAADDASARDLAWRQISDHEAALSECLLSFLRDRSDVRIFGRPDSDHRVRVPTISFVHDQMRSAEVVTAMDPHGIGIRYGHFYAARLIEALGLAADDGVIRVSMAHYNTLDEVDRLVGHLNQILG